MTPKPSRQSEVLAIIQRHGPITTAGITNYLAMTQSGINGHLKQMKGTLAHVSDWESSLSSTQQTRWAPMWQAGPGENVPMPKGRPTNDRPIMKIDLGSMPYRSVFAGGVSPWAGVTC